MVENGNIYASSWVTSISWASLKRTLSWTLGHWTFRCYDDKDDRKLKLQKSRSLRARMENCGWSIGKHNKTLLLFFSLWAMMMCLPHEKLKTNSTFDYKVHTGDEYNFLTVFLRVETQNLLCILRTAAIAKFRLDRALATQFSFLKDVITTLRPHKVIIRCRSISFIQDCL